MIKSREKKIMEYESAPSGYVTLYNYKEPFMHFKQGYGFEGVLLFDGTTDTIQCHFCGNWFGSLPHHLAREHGMSASEYKKKVGLRQTTALISETLRSKLIANGNQKRLQNLRKGGKKTEEQKKKISATLRNLVRETQNELGTCPEQIIDRLLKQYKELGRTPGSKEIKGYETMIRVYGSYKKACEVAGIPYNDPLEALKRGRIKRSLKTSKEVIINFMFEFFVKEGKLPIRKDFIELGKKNLYTQIERKYKFDELAKEVIFMKGNFVKNLHGVRFSKEELIKFLQMFEKNHGRKPSYSDAKRDLIPHLSRYSYHFGSWENACKIAFTNKT